MAHNNDKEIERGLCYLVVCSAQWGELQRIDWTLFNHPDVTLENQTKLKSLKRISRIDMRRNRTLDLGITSIEEKSHLKFYKLTIDGAEAAWKERQANEFQILFQSTKQKDEEINPLLVFPFTWIWTRNDD